MNGARGEVVLLVMGVERILCLTIGALAEMESLFGCSSLDELQVRLKRLSATELIGVLDILIRAGGGTACIKELLSQHVSPGDAARAVAEAFRAALG